MCLYKNGQKSKKHCVQVIPIRKLILCQISSFRAALQCVFSNLECNDIWQGVVFFSARSIYKLFVETVAQSTFRHQRRRVANISINSLLEKNLFKRFPPIQIVSSKIMCQRIFTDRINSLEAFFFIFSNNREWVLSFVLHSKSMSNPVLTSFQYTVVFVSNRFELLQFFLFFLIY